MHELEARRSAETRPVRMQSGHTYLGMQMNLGGGQAHVGNQDPQHVEGTDCVLDSPGQCIVHKVMQRHHQQGEDHQTFALCYRPKCNKIGEHGSHAATHPPICRPPGRAAAVLLALSSHLGQPQEEPEAHKPAALKQSAAPWAVVLPLSNSALLHQALRG